MVRVLAEDGEGPLTIVATDEIHHGIEMLNRIIFPQTFDARRCNICVIVMQEIIEDDGPERVIHGTVDFRHGQILTGHVVRYLIRRIFPHLADNDGVRIGAL